MDTVFSLGSLFADSTSLCQVNKKLTSTLYLTTFMKGTEIKSVKH